MKKTYLLAIALALNGCAYNGPEYLTKKDVSINPKTVESYVETEYQNWKERIKNVRSSDLDDIDKVYFSGDYLNDILDERLTEEKDKSKILRYKTIQKDIQKSLEKYYSE